MNRNKRIISMILAGALSAGQLYSVWAAPSEIYGVIVMDGIKYLTEEAKDENGNYIEAPSTTKFNVNKKYEDALIKNGISSKTGVDTISAATGGGSGGGGVGAARASVVFDFDMLSNALILKNLGMENGNSKAVLGEWNKAEKNFITKKGMLTGVSWSEYRDDAINAYGKGQDLTIEEYIEKYPDRLSCLPGDASYILEDGRFTRAIGKDFLMKKPYPSISISEDGNLSDKNLEIKILSDYDEFKDSIEKIEIFGDELSKDDYSFENGKLIIKKEKLYLGNNKISIESKVYRTMALVLDRYENIINPNVENNLKLGEAVYISGVTKSYIDRIKSITINGYTLEKGKSWSAEGNKIKLSEKLFNQNGYYSVIINASNTNTKVFFGIGTDKNDSSNNGNIIPVLSSKAVGFEDDIKITFDKNSSWQNAIYEVSYNKKTIPYVLGMGELTILTKDTQDQEIRRDNGEYELTIKAEGYPDAKVTVETLKEAPILKLKEIAEANKPFNLYIDQFQSHWEQNIKNVYIDGIALVEDQDYKKGSYGVMFSSKAVKTGGKHTVVIRSSGYTNYVREIYFKGEKSDEVLKKSPEIISASNNNSKDNDIKLTFKKDSAWQSSIENISLNGISTKEYSVSDGEIKIPGNLFNEGRNTIQINAKGFENANVDQYILKTVPRYVKMAYSEYDWSDYLPEIEGLSNFTRNKIVLNGVELNAKDYYYSYGRLSISSKTLDELILNVGINTLTLELDGYKPIDFKFNLVASNDEYDALSKKSFYVAIGNREIETVNLNGHRLELEDYSVESDGYISIKSNIKTLKLMNEGLNKVSVTIDGKEYERGQFTLKNLEKQIDTYRPKADFRTQNTLVAVGQDVTFENLSSSNSEEFEWIFEGADIEKSTEKNPVVKYIAEGVYKVTLKAKNQVDESIKERSSYIRVTDSAKDGLQVLSLNKPVTVSSENNRYKKENAVDGNLSTYWQTEYDGPHFIIVDLEHDCLISEVEIAHDKGYAGYLSKYSIETSVDGVNFEQAISINGNQSTTTKDVFSATEARFVKINLIADGWNNYSNLKIYDIKIKGVEIEKPKVKSVMPEEITVEEPKIEEPKVEEPKIEEPKVEEPKAEEPKAEEPKEEEPKAAEESKAEEPKAEEPKVEI